MELDLEGGEIIINGDTRISLPNYMSLLSFEDLQEASKNNEIQVVIAAGQDPNSGDVVMVTNQCKFFSIDCNTIGILDEGDVVIVTPTQHGKFVTIETENMIYDIDSDNLIEHSTDISVKLL